MFLFRLAWGFLGGDTARFSRFVAPPRAVAHHLRGWLRSEPDVQVGHNPAGGWMVLLLLGLLLIETLTGVYVANDIADEGPLTEMVPAPLANAIASAHAIVWNALLAAIVLHIVAVASFAAIKGHNLLRPMINGTKLLPGDVDAPKNGASAKAALSACVYAPPPLPSSSTLPAARSTLRRHFFRRGDVRGLRQQDGTGCAR